MSSTQTMRLSVPGHAVSAGRFHPAWARTREARARRQQSGGIPCLHFEHRFAAHPQLAPAFISLSLAVRVPPLRPRVAMQEGSFSSGESSNSEKPHASCKRRAFCPREPTGRVFRGTGSTEQERRGSGGSRKPSGGDYAGLGHWPTPRLGWTDCGRCAS